MVGSVARIAMGPQEPMGLRDLAHRLSQVGEGGLSGHAAEIVEHAVARSVVTALPLNDGKKVR
jgi:hypothetical protein